MVSNRVVWIARAFAVVMLLLCLVLLSRLHSRLSTMQPQENGTEVGTR